MNILQEIRVAPRRELPILAIGTLIGLAVAGPSGYFLAKKRLENHYIQMALEEIEDAKEFYRRQLKVEEYSDPNELAQHYMDTVPLTREDLAEQVQELGYINIDNSMREFPNVVPQGAGISSGEEIDTEENSDVEEESEVEHSDPPRIANVFAKDEESKRDGWDFGEELALRHELDEGAPYVIHFEEFENAELGYTQVSVTYFEGDDVLVDERDLPIDEIEATVGNDNLDKFGHGSNDKNIVYIRNDRLGVDFEVSKSSGSFAEEVHGGTIRHSADRTKVRKMRRDDE